MDVDHAWHHGEPAEVICGVGSTAGFNRGDFGSLHHHRRIPQDLAGPVDHAGRVDANRRALRDERRRGENSDKQSQFDAHAADYNPRTRAMLKSFSTALLLASVVAGASFSGARWAPLQAPPALGGGAPPAVGGRAPPARPSLTAAREWPFYGADQGGTKYSPLADINRSNVSRLAVAWEGSAGEKALAEFGTRPGNFQATPIMIGGVLYFSTPYNRVVALNADTGAELWSFDPKAYEDGQPPNGTGFVHRGVAAWRDSARNNALRVFINSRYRLICLDAATGRPVDSFGAHGIVDLSKGLVWEINKTHYTNTSPPVVFKDLVILGNGGGHRLAYLNDPPGDVRAFDAHTGKQVWTFHTIPQPGEVGNDTWGNDSWSYTGHTNAWAPMSLDAVRGLV